MTKRECVKNSCICSSEFLNTPKIRNRKDDFCCVNQYENEQDCPCSEENCEYHGICCECIKYHKNCKDLPVCLKKDK